MIHLTLPIPMNKPKHNPHIIHECRECGEQWAEKGEQKILICHSCFSHKIDIVCRMEEQIHLLQHDEAIC